MHFVVTVKAGRTVWLRSTVVEFAIVGSQRAEMSKVLKMVEPRIFIDILKRILGGTMIVGRVWGQDVDSPGTMHTRPTKGGSPGTNGGSCGLCWALALC